MITSTITARGQLNALRAADSRISDVRGGGLVWNFEVIDRHGRGDPLLGAQVHRCLSRHESGWRAHLIGVSTITIVLAHPETTESAVFRDALLDIRRVLAASS